ncbi:serpin B6-like isoform X7 [Anthonomus grandis grandis]|uniref:serpin B6-like isoform X7 n=1 Tax=Anthonomus grandis grandis TaxID=2921223 RepID=UPI0021652516|nr:serpin B6-like isoform X7 [Anthonomus grandis grandis]
MGLKRAFTEQADFGDMIKNEALQISKVVQKAFIEVNEEGSEAAAATAVMMMRCSAFRPKPLPVEFKADHTFIFMLLGRMDGHRHVLFNGRLANI